MIGPVPRSHMQTFARIGGREFLWEYPHPPQSGTLVYIEGFGPFQIGDWWSDDATYTRQVYHLFPDDRGGRPSPKPRPENPSTHPVDGFLHEDFTRRC